MATMGGGFQGLGFRAYLYPPRMMVEGPFKKDYRH